MNSTRVVSVGFLSKIVKKLIILLIFTSFQFVFSQTQSNNSNSNDSLIDFEYSIYPNPSKDFIFFKTAQHFKALNISIVNSNGKTVRIVSAKEKNTIKIDLKELSNGMYFMTIKSSKKILGIKQFIIRK